MNTSTPAATAFDALPVTEQLGRVKNLARQALPLYGLPFDSDISLLNYSENATWLVKPPPETPNLFPKRVLRINRPGYNPRPNINTELDWVLAIRRDTPIITADPIPGLDGEFVQHIWHKDVPQPRNCVLLTFLEGVQPDETNRRAAFQLLGDVTARLHKHVLNWRPPRPLHRLLWNFDNLIGPNAYWGNWRDNPDLDAPTRALIERALPLIQKRVTALGTDPDRFNLIHADLRDANLLIHNGQVAAIDFDDCGFSWFMHDLAAALSFMETAPDAPDCVDAWFTGYNKIRTLSKPERDELDTFILLRRLQLTAWIGSHADTAQARSVRPGHAAGTALLCEKYLRKHA
ncbi:MAG: phosphotransferase [Opitutaceae bacterium]|jgi:Ser/Thr protein kinase RdoA (MazF antagonist)|nr:phosphotransferase [Opitutaceae bacterium]